MTPTEFDGAVDDGGDLQARTTTRDDGTVECTLFPADASETARVTRWITAEEGTYVDLDRMR